MPLSSAGFMRLKKLVRKATSAGAVGLDVIDGLALDDEVLRDALILIRGGGASAARVACELVRKVLESQNSKIRYRGLLLSDEIFLRSKAFRKALCKDIRGFAQSVMQIPGLSDLPPPEKAQVLLHRTALQIMTNWGKHFGDEQPPLVFTLQFINAKLGQIGRVLGGRQAAEARQRQERSRRLRLAQFETVCDEMSDQSGNQVYTSMCASLEEVKAALELMDNRFNNLNAQFRKSLNPSVTSGIKGSLSNSAETLSSEQTRMPPISESNAEADESDESDDDDFDVDWSTVKPGDLTTENTSKSCMPDRVEAVNEPKQQPQVLLALGNNKCSDSLADDEVDDDMEEWASFHHEAKEREAHRQREQEMVEHLAPDFRLEVNLRQPPKKEDVLKDEDLAPVIASFKDAVREFERTYLPQLERWIRILTRAELLESSSRMRRGNLLGKALDVKRGFKDAQARGEAYGIHFAPVTNGEEMPDFLRLLEGDGVGHFVDERTRRLEEEDRERRKKEKKERSKKRKLQQMRDLTSQAVSERSSKKPSSSSSSSQNRPGAEDTAGRRKRAVFDPFAKPAKRNR